MQHIKQPMKNYEDNEEEYHEDKGIQLMDVEGYRSDKDEGFSHQRDVAKAISRVLETGSQEMIPGYTDFKKDKASGELIMSKYHPDTREVFIESVNNLYDICIAEITKSKNYSEKIKTIVGKKKKSYQYWAVKEHKFWKNLDYQTKKQTLHIPGSIAKQGHFYSQFMVEMISISRELAREINLLLDEGKYWKRVGKMN